MKVAVIGGGISGLATAYHLKKDGLDVTLFESRDHVGGNIRTEWLEGFLLEHGPNSLLASTEILDLIDELGIANKIAYPSPLAKKRFIVRNGRMIALPSGAASLLSTKAFSISGKLRILKEPFIRSRSSEGETVADFFSRRFGQELTDYAVDPFISGIYAGDPNRLGIRNAFPRIFEFEARFGSVIRGAILSRKDKSAKLPKGFPRSFTFTEGMSSLIDALCERLGKSIIHVSPASEILVEGNSKYRVCTQQGEEVVDSVIISTPAHAAERLIENLDAQLAVELSNIYYPPISVVFAGFRREQVKTIPAGFGVLVPSAERRNILGCLFTSSVFENRAPSGYHLFTIFVGGSRNAELCDKTENEIVHIALDEMRKILSIEGEPVFSSIKKWDKAIPQYNAGYESVLLAIDQFRGKYPGIFFCSNFYKGISVGDCVKNSFAIVREVNELLGNR